MIAKLLNTQKGALLKGAARHGPVAFARQLSVVLKDSFIRKRHLVFEAGAAELAAPPDTELPRLEPLETQAALEDFLKGRRGDDSPVYWGETDWFAQGFRCWGGRMNGVPACLGWIRTAEQSPDFFVPIPSDKELLWHTTTFPEWRGRSLHRLFLCVLIGIRTREGVTGFMTNCREFNMTAERSILRIGFRQIGHCDEAVRSGDRVWTAKDGT